MASSNIIGDTHFQDRLSAGKMAVPANAVDNAAITAPSTPANAVAASKLMHRHVVSYRQIATADTITDGTFLLHLCRTIGAIVKVKVSSAIAPDADTDFFTVDIRKVRLGVSATILAGNAPVAALITYDNTRALAGDGGDVNGNYGIVNGELDGAELVTAENDVIEAIIVQTNAGNTNAAGLVITLTIDEEPSV